MLLPALVVVLLGSSPAGIGVIEGVAIGVGALARLGGAALLHHPERRRRANLGGYAGLAACTSLMAAAGATGQAGVLRSAATVAGGFRGTATPLGVYEEAGGRQLGRAFGSDRALEYLGAGAGAALAVALVAAVDIRAAIALAALPGVLAVVAAWRSRRPRHWVAPSRACPKRCATCSGVRSAGRSWASVRWRRPTSPSRCSSCAPPSCSRRAAR